jgi:hypothetical protein
MAVKRIVHKGMHVNNQVRLYRGGDRNLATEFLWFMSLAFSDTVNFWCVDTVDFAFAGSSL